MRTGIGTKSRYRKSLLSATVRNCPSANFGNFRSFGPVRFGYTFTDNRAGVKMNTSAPLFLVTLDSQKALDVVMGIHTTLWNIINFGCVEA